MVEKRPTKTNRRRNAQLLINDDTLSEVNSRLLRVLNMKNLMNETDPNTCNPASGCCPPVTLGRRDFIKASGLTAAMLMAGRTGVMAGPFTKADFEHVIPADKKLTQAWIDGLYARGEPLTATGDNLKYIGMPISGIATGQVYLGGDGRLWCWNLNATKDNKHTPKGDRYMRPDQANPSAGQGFALRVNGAVRTLDANGFNDVTFTNQYPMGIVDYADADCPVTVQLEAYTPYIPLNRDKSSYPVIVMRYTVTNTSDAAQDVAMAGWIENYLNGGRVQKTNTYHELEDIATVECSGGSDNPNMMALGLFGTDKPEFINLEKAAPGAEGVFAAGDGVADGGRAQRPGNQRAFASLGRSDRLAPGASKTLSFAVSWRVPNIRYGVNFGRGAQATAPGRNHYATVFQTATQASAQVAGHQAELHGASKQWVDTWYDSTLPYWFLERCFIPNNCMQTQVAQRVYPQDGDTDIYNLEEGVRCCPGNCTHVWNYAQGLARVFPEIERECRDKIEYGQGFDADTGMIYFRYTVKNSTVHKDEALDGTCGTIIRVLRESQMTTDYSFLASIWGRVKMSMDHVIQKWDADEDGVLAGAQHNTLDEPWYGRVHWLMNVYHAALKAAAIMARQMDEPGVAERYEAIIAKGVPVMVEQLWNEDFGYFIHIPPVDETQMHGSTNGCHIDQVLGDSWLHEVGLEPVLPRDKTKQALQSLWKYNFTPDVGAYRKVMTNGRWYAAAGDAGLVMTSFPFGKVEPKSGNKNYAGYLNECMTGFEWQVAAHMIREGMLEEGLAIGKAIYDRYAPDARNPYNEIECSDHYSRAMASYGAFLAMCGYRYDGPEAKLGFGPKMQQDNFRAAFTTAQGWGRFTQTVQDGKQANTLELHYGKLHLKQLTLDAAPGVEAGQATVTIDDQPINTQATKQGSSTVIRFPQGLDITAGQTLQVLGA